MEIHNHTSIKGRLFFCQNFIEITLFFLSVYKNSRKIQQIPAHKKNKQEVLLCISKSNILCNIDKNITRILYLFLTFKSFEIMH